jgi:hypothetical protein
MIAMVHIKRIFLIGVLFGHSALFAEKLAHTPVPVVRRISAERIERLVIKYTNHVTAQQTKNISKAAVGAVTVGSLIAGLWWFLDKKEKAPAADNAKSIKDQYREEWLKRSTGWGYVKHSLIKDVGVVTLVTLLMQGVHLTWKSLDACVNSTFTERCAEGVLRRLVYAANHYCNTLEALHWDTVNICGTVVLESYNTFISALEHALAWHRLAACTDEQALVFTSLKTLVMPLNAYADQLERVVQSGWSASELKKCINVTRSLLGPWTRIRGTERDYEQD